MWHNSAALGYFPGWYWPSQGIPTDLSTSPSEGGINYWCLQISAKFEVQQGIISRNVSRFLHVSEFSAFSMYILLFCLLYLYPKSMDYCHGLVVSVSNFFALWKSLVLHIGFSTEVSSIMFSYARVFHWYTTSVEVAKWWLPFGQTVLPVCTQSCQRTVATFSSSVFLQVLLYTARGQCLGSYIQLVEGAEGCNVLGGRWQLCLGRAESVPGVMRSVVRSA
jgi:hypothetical protein